MAPATLRGVGHGGSAAHAQCRLQPRGGGREGGVGCRGGGAGTLTTNALARCRWPLQVMLENGWEFATMRASRLLGFDMATFLDDLDGMRDTREMQQPGPGTPARWTALVGPAAAGFSSGLRHPPSAVQQAAGCPARRAGGAPCLTPAVPACVRLRAAEWKVLASSEGSHEAMERAVATLTARFSPSLMKCEWPALALDLAAALRWGSWSGGGCCVQLLCAFDAGEEGLPQQA